MRRRTPQDRGKRMFTKQESTGRIAVAAGVLSIVGVEGEWLLPAQQDDGTVTSKPAFALLLVCATVGFALLCVAATQLRRGAWRSTRPARVGSAMSVAGSALLTIFAVVAMATGLGQGAVLEASFVLFALAMLLLAVGALTWGLSLRRGDAPAGVWQALTVSGLAALGLLAIPVDPWHDVSMVVMFGAWALLGARLLHSRRELAAASV